MIELPNGDIVASGLLGRVGTTELNGIARWTGTSWQPIGNFEGHGPQHMSVLSNGDLACSSDTANFDAPGYVQTWDGTSWHQVGTETGVLGFVTDLTTLASGDVLVCGRMFFAGGVAMNHIGRWDGVSWHAFGTGVDNWGDRAAELPNGDIVTAGLFREAGGLPATRAARWDGTTWHAMGSGLPSGSIRDLLALPNGHVLVAGLFSGARLRYWNGSSWSPYGVTDAAASALAQLPDGRVAVCGSFHFIDGVAANYLAVHDGIAWGPLSPLSANAPIHAMDIALDGSLVVGGEFHSIGGVPMDLVARWDGTSWTAVGHNLTGSVTKVRALSDGSLLVHGSIRRPVDPSPVRQLRWDGVAWSLFGDDPNDTVNACLERPDGSILLGGHFTGAGSTASNAFARLVSSRAATAVEGTNTCIGPVGPMTLAATHLPWLGGAYSARCDGFTAGSLGASVFGLGSAATPLGSIHPSGIAGCDLLVSTDSVALRVPVAGQVTAELAIPATAAILGFVLHHQVLQGDFNAGALTSLSGSNAVALTVGSW